MYAHIKTRPRRLQSLRKDLPEALDELIFRMLDKTPQQRPTADEVAQQLRLLSGLEEHAGSSLSHHHSGTESLRPGSVASRAVTWSSAPRHRLLPTRAGAVAALVTLASAALGVLGPQLHSGVTFLVSAPHPKPSLLVPQQPAAQTPGPQTPDVVSKQYDLTQLSARTPDGMVLIPARSFRMGSTPKQQADAMEWCKEESSQCELDYWTREKQSGLITVSPFYLDRTEVTNHEYLRFLQAHTSQFHIREQRGHRRIYDEKNRPLISLEDGIDVLAPSRLLLTELIVQKVDDSRPASSVSWFGAARFCRWKGHILPSEAQWEAAARGVSADGSPSLFPWGDSRPTCDGVGIAQEANPNVKVSKPLCSGQGSVGLRAVGTSWQDRTPHGVMDLAGNVMEWVRDEYVNPYPWEDGDRDPVHQSSPALEDTEVVRVRRGGSYSVEASSARATTRYQSNSTATKAGVGFRCAHEVSSASSRPTSNP
jgi:formylglycine-generating enzyme required for sulfatase activity